MPESPRRIIRARFLGHRWGLGFSLAIGLALSLATATAAAGAAPRVVAVGDVHGDVVAFQKILQEAGVVDADGGWVGGETVLVQLGDLIDRGPSMRGTLDFVMGLEQKSSKHGGRVVSLLGNHEVMNVTGDLRYVVPANYAEFANAGSEKRRAEAWSQVQALRKRRARKLGQPDPPSGRDAREKWFQAHPAGFLEQREAFGPGGRYGRWLRARPALHVAGGTAFMHGGLSPALAGSSLEEIDRRVHEDLERFDADMALFVSEDLILPFFDFQETTQAVRETLVALEAANQAGKTDTTPPGDAKRREIYQRFLNWGSWTMNSAEGPLWFRGFAQWSDAEGEANLPLLLAAAGVQRFVVGHSVQEDRRVRVRFGGTVFLIDTGMLASYVPGGRGSALEIVDGTVSVIYAGEPREVIWQAPRPAAAVPGERGDCALVAGSR